MDERKADEILSALDMLTETVARLARRLDEAERAAERRALALEGAVHRLSERLAALEEGRQRGRAVPSQSELVSGLGGMSALSGRLSRQEERDGA